MPIITFILTTTLVSIFMLLPILSSLLPILVSHLGWSSSRPSLHRRISGWLASAGRGVHGLTMPAFGTPLLIARRGKVEFEVHSYEVADAMVARAEGDCKGGVPGAVLGGGAGQVPAVEVVIGDLRTIQEDGEGAGEVMVKEFGVLPSVPHSPADGRPRFRR